MLRIGKLTDYAMLIMSQLAKSEVSLMSAASLAEALRLTIPTVSKVLKMLAEAGLVTSVRGAEGGYSLSRSATEISITDVISAMEGNFALTECCDKVGLCAIDESCTMRGNWRQINNMVYTMLAKLSILDMSEPLSQGLLYGK